MGSGSSLPIPDATVAPLVPGEGEGAVAGDVQPGVGIPGAVTPEGSVAQPGAGTPGAPVAQPAEGAVVPPPAAVEPRPGQTAEERIQGLVAEVATLKTTVADLEDVRDLADELDEVLVALRGAQPVTPAPGAPQPAVPPATVPPGQPAQPAPPTGVEGQIAQLTQVVQGLQGLVQRVITQPDEAAAYKDYAKIEDGLLATANITNETEVVRVKEMVNKEMEAGKHDWTRPRVAKRVIRGQIAEFQKLKADLLTASVGPAATPGAPAAPAVAPGVPSPDAPVAVTPEVPEVEPLDQAAQELGPILEQVFKKGGGVV